MSSISRASTIVERARQIVDVFSDCEFVSDGDFTESLCQKLTHRPSLRVKFGVDPTATELHLGWMVPLRRLRRLQDLGHTVILVIGDFTATIGDPSGKSTTRKQLTQDEVFQNSEELEKQFDSVLDMSKTLVRCNNDWWKNTSSREFLSMFSSITVAQIMERKDFAERFSGHQAIGMHELIYPILQAHDSVMVEADIELGGSDQRFNCQLGRDVMSSKGMSPQAVVLTPLLVGLDGVKKMSQSLGNFISVRDLPNDMFGKVMSITDEAIEAWWKMLQLPDFELSQSGDNPKNIKKALAERIVEMCHGAELAHSAIIDFESKFEKRDWQSSAPKIELSFESGQTKSLASLLVDFDMAKSTSDARRLIQDGAVEIAGERMQNPMEIVVVESLRNKHIKVGKRRFAHLI